MEVQKIDDSCTILKDEIPRICHLERDMCKYYYCNKKCGTDGICYGFDDDTKTYIELKDTHEYTGPAYKCEDCNRWGCRECLMDDGWENRLADGVFLCYRCYLMAQSLANIM